MEVRTMIVRGARRCAAEGDVRYYLNGVFFDFRRGLVCATNGHILYVGQMDKADCDSAIVPNAAIDVLFRNYKEDAFLVNIEPRASEIYLPGCDYRVHYKAIDGKFPDFSAVVRRATADGTPGTFNPKLLRQAQIALCGKSESGWRWTPSGPNHAGVMTADRAMVFVMPMRSEDGVEYSRKQMAWLRESNPEIYVESEAQPEKAPE